MALSASAKDYLSRFFPGPPSPLWETDPEFMELFANFALDEVVNQGDLDDAARMMAILAALLGCQGVEEYRVLLPAALRAGVTPVQVKEILYGKPKSKIYPLTRKQFIRNFWPYIPYNWIATSKVTLAIPVNTNMPMAWNY